MFFSFRNVKDHQSYDLLQLYDILLIEVFSYLNLLKIGMEFFYNLELKKMNKILEEKES